MEIIASDITGAEFWITVFIACLFGAMSPGPSLGVIVNHSLIKGRMAGFSAAISHGFGIGLYALVTTFGLAKIIQQNNELFSLIQFIGCLFLLFLSVKLIFSENQPDSLDVELTSVSSNLRAARDGMFIALLNPKILVFFTALFSQFVRIESTNIEKLYLALIAGSVDAAWYLFVALIISSSVPRSRLQNIGFWLDKVFGLFLAVIAIRFILQLNVI